MVARAASPWERLEYAGFAPAPVVDDARVDRREDAWVRAVAGGDHEAFAALLERRGLTREYLCRGLADVVVSDINALPAWACDLRDLLEPAVDDEAAIDPFTVGEVLKPEDLRAAEVPADRRWSLHTVFEPLLQVAARRLREVTDAAPVPLAPGVPRRMLAQLARGWASASAQLLLHRVEIADLLDGHPGRLGDTVVATFFGDESMPPLDRWRRLFATYPVLARLLAVALRNWRDATAELLTRLVRDRDALQRTFANGGPLGRVEAYHAEAGDLHDRGRSVTILAFSCGTRVVYKPKELRIAAAYARLTHALNNAGLALPIHVRAVVLGDGYAWEAFVATASCETDEDVRRFYWRLGMHARLAQLTGGSDLTTDNVVAAGEHPVLIDLETLVAPDIALTDETAPAERVALARSYDFPVRSGLITALIVSEPGRRPAEMGALAAGNRIAPFRQATVRTVEDGRVAIVHDYATFSGNSATPMLRGEPARPAHHLASVVRGYLDMGACLRRHAAGLAAPGGPLDDLVGARVRVIVRDTHIYARLLQESIRPRRLRDGIEREICLDRLWKARLEQTVIIRAEIDALRDGEIPMFAARLGTDALEVGDYGSVPSFFSEDALAQVRARLDAATRHTETDEVDAIRAALFLALPGAEPSSEREFATPAAAPPTDWLGAAVRVGDAMLAAALPGVPGPPVWFGLTYYPTYDAWQIGLLGDDILSGTAGLAVVLADLYRLSGLARFQYAAQAVLDGLTHRVRDALAELARRPPVPLFCGALHGWGAWLYACRRGAESLGNPDILARAVAVLDGAPLHIVHALAPPDLVGGRAGLLLAVLGVPPAMTTPRLRKLAQQLGDNLWARHGSGALTDVLPYPPDAPVMSTLPDTAAGIALALLRLDATAGALGLPFRLVPDAVVGLVSHLDGVAQDGAAADGPPRPNTSGQLLTRLAIARYVADAAPHALRDARAFVRDAAAAPTTARRQLEAAEVAITAYQFARHGDDLGRGRELAGALAARDGAFGVARACTLAPDRYDLSAVWGVGAIAHLFAKLHAPHDVASLRLIE